MCIGKHLSDNFLLLGDALSPFLFNSPLEYAIRKIHENQVGLKLYRTHQLPANNNDVNLLKNNTDTTKKNNLQLILVGRLVQM
jgi:hypothetical protein